MAVTKARQPFTPARIAGWTLLVLLALFLLIQLVPYGRAHAQPAVTGEPAWPAGARQLAVRACYDCHSNQTVWPWYSNIAPVSWLVQHDVDDGRRRLNFSEWNQGGFGGEAAAVLMNGQMPPVYYTWIHPGARLSDTEKQQLAQALQSLPMGGP